MHVDKAMNILSRLAVSGALCVAALAQLPSSTHASSVAGAPIIVNDPGDAGGGCDLFGNCRPCDGTGTCTLRQAIDVANAGGGNGWVGQPRTDIRFNFGSALGVIALTSALPDITRYGVSIRGTTVAGAAQDVLINGALTNSDLFRVRAGNVSITDLTLLRPPPTNSGNERVAAIRMLAGAGLEVGRMSIGVEATAGEGICNAVGRSNSRNDGLVIENGTSGNNAVRTAWVHNSVFGCLRSGVQLNGADWVEIGARPDGYPGGNRFGITSNGVAAPLEYGVLIAGEVNEANLRQFGNSTDHQVRHNLFAHNYIAVALFGNFGNDTGTDGVHRVYILQNTIRAADPFGYADLAGVQIGGRASNIHVGVASGLGIAPFGGNHIFGMGSAAVNTGCMVRVVGDRSTDIFVNRNFIGTNGAGTSAAVNHGHGVCLVAGASATIGQPSQGNVISGNTRHGVYLHKTLVASPDVRRVTIQANKIGTNLNGEGLIANGGSGVYVTSSREITIGGPQSAQGNTIAGNTGFGIYLSEVSTATIQSNQIGGALPGWGNGADGIAIEGGSRAFTIGAAGAENYILRNGRSGLFIGGGAQGIQVQQNLIADNALHGVWLRNTNTAYNLINASTILRNGGDGIAEDDNAGLNRFVAQAIAGNGGLGIDKNSNNTNDGPFASVSSIANVNGVPRVSGTAAFNPLAPRSVQVYRASSDPSGYGEGYQWIGTADVTGAGTWSIDDIASGEINGCYTGVLEEAQVTLLGPTGFRSSFEFGPVLCVPMGGLSVIVDRTDDRTPVVGACTAAVNDCTLREAIAIANADAQPTSIAFDPVTFPDLTPRDIALDFGRGPLTLSDAGTRVLPTSAQRIRVYGTASSPEQLQPVFTILGNNAIIGGFDSIRGGAPYQIRVGGTASRAVIFNSTIGGIPSALNANTLTCDTVTAPGSFSQAGVYVDATGGSAANPTAWIYGNHIGCNLQGSGIVLAGADAVRIGVDELGNYGFAQANRIGLNSTHGIYATGNADLNVIRGNLIYSNTIDGIQLFSSNSAGPGNNVIGCNPDAGSEFNGSNVIVRNGSSGVELSGPGTSLINYVACNYIGFVDRDWGVAGIPAVTDAATAASNGNAAEGIMVRNRASFNFIGGVGAGVGNLLFGNVNGIVADNAPDNFFNRNSVVYSPNYAILLLNGSDNAQARHLTLVENGGGVYINASTNALIENGVIMNSRIRGIQIENATGNTISATVVISSGYSGVTFDNAAGNQLIGGAVISSTRHGIEFNGAASTGNLIDSTIVGQNGLDGIADTVVVSGNRWFPSSVTANGGLGVDRGVTGEVDNIVNTPPVTITQLNSVTFGIVGAVTDAAIVRVDVYVNRGGADPSGFGEGERRVGSPPINGGNWSINDPGMQPGDCYSVIVSTATQSSEFSRAVCVPGAARSVITRWRVLAPVVRR
jgi:Right handed beta helix region